jgi:hypothetical protein
LYAAWSKPDDLVYTGLMFDVPDHAQYWSWVTASRDGLFISNTMTPEDNAPIFLNPTMWLLSKAQLAFGLSFAALFQWWRIVAIVLFTPILLAFMRTMVPEVHRRRLAIALALVGGGLGWIWIVGKKLTGAADVPFPHDLYTIEPNTFWTLLSYPYILLADALVLATMLAVWLAYRRRHWPWLALAAAAAAALSMSHPYDLITVYTVLGVYGLFEWIRTRQFPTRLAVVGAAVAIASGPLAFYYQRLTSADPLWRSILSQYSNAGVWTPVGYHLVILLGLPLLLAAWSFFGRAAWSDERRFAAVWALTSVGLVYLPVVFQIKLLTAWQFPIAILAAHAWYDRVVPSLPKRVAPQLAAAAIVVGAALTNLYLVAWRFVELRRHEAPYFMHQDERAALMWLDEHSRPSDVVLAPEQLGQFAPNYGGTRAYLAHWAMTNRYFERRQNVARFFDRSTSDEWRRELLDSEGVTLVMHSTWSDPSNAVTDFRSEYELVFDSPKAKVYRFRGADTDRWARGAEK